MKLPDLPEEHEVPGSIGGIVYVSASGSDRNGGLLPQFAVLTLSNAARIARTNASKEIRIHGDLVLSVPDGNHAGASIDYCSNLTVSGGWDSNFAVQDGTTTLRGGGYPGNSLSVICLRGCTGVVLTNLTITGGYATSPMYYGDWGGGVRMESCNGCRIVCRIVGNGADNGSGIGMQTCFSNFIDSVVESNSAPNDGAKYHDGGGIYMKSCQGNTIHGTICCNTVTAGTGEEYGGGIYLLSGTNNVVDAHIYGNSGRNGGGGVFFEKAYLSTVGGSIENNTATGDGGGIYLKVSANVSITASILSNTASSGGGVIIENVTGSTFDSSCVIRYNHCTVHGGGICQSGGSGNTIQPGAVVTNNYLGSGTGTEDNVYGM